jgi:deoxyribose-phosphate aldolase
MLYFGDASKYKAEEILTDQEILSYVDHTLLKPAASFAEIEKTCGEALAYKTASACIPPCYVKAARGLFPALNICSVIGFPLGYNGAEIKIAETKKALADGADEIDMVINIGAVKSGFFDLVESEIRRIKEVVGGKILKVIIETCYVTEAEKIRLCGIISKTGADFIKTSTGFGSAGAVLDDIFLFKKHIAPSVKIKAAGGIKTKEAMIAFINAGCARIGSSATTAVFAQPSV